jgi:hypothetical protein
MWWTEGPPHFLSMKGAPPPPVLCLRSGEIGLLIDTKSLRLPHAGRFAAKQAKDTALEAGTRPLLALPATELQMSVVWAGKTFTCTGRGIDRHQGGVDGGGGGVGCLRRAVSASARRASQALRFWPVR